MEHQQQLELPRLKPVPTKLSWSQRKIMAIIRRAQLEGRQVTIKKDLMPALRCSNYQVRLLIQQMQDIGAPVCTTEHGVQLVQGPDQLEDQFKRMCEHGISTLARAYRLKGCRLTQRTLNQAYLQFQPREAARA
jgi:biotin operon repressor